MIKKSEFGKLSDGRKVHQYLLENSSGLKIAIIDYGAIVTNIFTKDREGERADIVLGYDTLSGYVNDKSFMGAIVGRYGNRIRHGKFEIGDQQYQLTINNGSNHLHGGFNGFYAKLWREESLVNNSDPSVKLVIESPNGEEGYPGNVLLKILYTVTEENELVIHYEGTTDKTTILNPTHHSYFNLTGDFKKDILNHYLQINASSFTPVDDEQIPTGEIKNVEDTVFDFRKSRLIGLHINESDPQILIGSGYDHNFVINNYDKTLQKAAEVYEPGSGRMLEVFTDQPGLQFYSGNSLNESTGKKGIKHYRRTGFCLEAQHFPDSPNHINFPGVILEPGEVYRQTTIYKFSNK